MSKEEVRKISILNLKLIQFSVVVALQINEIRDNGSDGERIVHRCSQIRRF